MTHTPLPIPTYSLNDGAQIPAIGLGTYKLSGSTGVEAMVAAIRAGYRLLDSAVHYENEGAVGRAVRRSGIPREELILTSKLPGRHHEYSRAVNTVHESLYRAGLDYWDMYLIHWPNPRRGLYVEAFQALADMQKAGLIRTVGVSNFLPEHIERVRDEVGMVPAVNQIEMHPYFPQTEQRLAHNALGIQTQSWSPIGRGNGVADEKVIHVIAEEMEMTPIQVILRWHIQLGSIPLPKSAHPQRQQENLDVWKYELSPEHMSAITALGKENGRRTNQDPLTYEDL
ncbi:MAG: 2,5-diketo-D-gluconic acid reductase [Actinobacteria bacterium]|nr:MAG: 2,5-diketo-D-gluconic acid reductase [Actinomycetota bacterium]